MRIRIYILVLLSMCYSGLTAQTAYKNEFGFRNDNDAYLAYGQDQYYTNGLFIYFRQAMNQSKHGQTINKQIWEVEAGQKMYNPFTGNVPKISQIDRPFAAYLYAGASLSRFYNSENSLKVSLQVGTIGPRALGKEAQELIHRIGGFYKIKGWETQIKNEIGINSILEYNHFLSRSSSQKTDFSLTGAANLGNTFAGASLGILFRIGDINQMFNSASTNSSISNNSTTAPLVDREFFFFAKPSLNFIAYNATIQGGMFQKEKEVVTFDIHPWVFSQELGLKYSKKRWTADFSIIFKSREVKSWAKANQYGSLGLCYRFN
ncbi:MAG TPA: lipid A deacylase LpxR family protein [Daejeonella sp.]|nr:lipid A deacylase LpxR family protein [Daejeonella sp.]